MFVIVHVMLSPSALITDPASGATLSAALGLQLQLPSEYPATGTVSVTVWVAGVMDTALLVHVVVVPTVVQAPAGKTA